MRLASLLPTLCSLAIAMILPSAPVMAADAASGVAPKEDSWVLRDFTFRSGEVLPELRIHYTTIGDPKGEPVLILHGTTQSGANMLLAPFADGLFGPGQPLDARRYFIILPDAIGHGKSSKPSDGLRTRFPKYDYDDMVEAQYRLVTEHLQVPHLRLMLGFSMGGMETWLFAQKYPGFMDIAVPMASMPIPMSGRNWMMRRLIIDSIRNDPAWMNGNYTQQPHGARFASVFFNVAANGGTQALQQIGSTREKADKALAQRMAAPFPADANDVLYQWESSRDFDPSAGLERIQATVLAINSADDERNPPELNGVMERELKRVQHARFYQIPASEKTFGHATAYFSRFWNAELAKLLQETPHLAN